MANSKNKVHPSADKLNNFAPEKGNDADYSLDHVQSGPQKTPNVPAPAHKKIKPGK
jgi:hypothetical protein